MPIRNLVIRFGFIVACAITSVTLAQQPMVDADVVFQETDGVLAVEAEHFFKQTKADVRAFHLTTKSDAPGLTPDGDPSHIGGASGGAYLEILPDTRRNHSEKLIQNVNFCPTAGKMAVLHYKVNINTPGKYYVWVRAYSTGSEDNGLHVGIDGQWPASGNRMQWCQGKRSWRWESKQRTEKEHCGEPFKIFLQIDKPGPHTIQFSMREDGFEFDKWLITTDRSFKRPSDAGPTSIVKSGKLPKPFALVAAPPKPNGPPAPQPDPKSSTTVSRSLRMPAKMFAQSKMDNYYMDRGKWLAIDPDSHKSASIKRTFPFPTGKYHVVLRTVGENDGRSFYAVAVGETKIGSFTNPLAGETYAEGAKFNKTWKNVSITEGAIIQVTSKIGSEDGQEFSRARWSAVEFRAADDATQKLVAPMLAQQKETKTTKTSQNKTSPTKSLSDLPLQQPRKPDGDGSVTVSGELKQWHKVTFDLDGMFAHEKDNSANPFTDFRMTLHLQHADGTKLTIPGYFAADGGAANSGAESGTTWRAHFAPPKTGQWTYRVSFLQGKNIFDVASNAKPTTPPKFNQASGKIVVAESDKTGRDLRAHGQLKYVGKHYLQFAGSKMYFLKVGADAPETLLAYKDFDNTIAGNRKKAPLKSWSAHLGDWKAGDPSWKDGKGKGLIGAINYLSAKGCNAFSFLTYNAGGDGDNIWPFIHRDDKLHYDCSKLDQWGIVLEHGTTKGMYLHFKMQETENDDHRRGHQGSNANVPECLDGGKLGIQRKLYCRELIARFGHNLALNWNLGEENTQSHDEQQAMINYIADLDVYDHNIVVHTYPNQQDIVYRPLLGDASKLTGTSLQNSSLKTTHEQTVKWVRESASAGKPWIVAFDESGSAAHAQCPDLGYNGFDGHDRQGKMAHTQHEVRKYTLWGTLMAGGAGNEYYFGYQVDQNDIICEDWRSRDQSWDYCRIAIEFFHQNKIPFWDMKNADALVGNADNDSSKFCFAKTGEVYLVYLPSGGTTKLDLSGVTGKFQIHWFNPRSGGPLSKGSVTTVNGGANVNVGNPPRDTEQDWLVVLRRP